ncbi:MAG: HDOD domain-containing protein [Campylobacterota bacterium]|nr:HDOD domain-containing protein [Campylobacterota bacterium]
MKNSIVDNIKSLPPLPKTIMDVQRIKSDPDASIMDLAKVIETDPMIVANLLKAANSPLYSFGREIKNVSQAVSLFGMNMTSSIAIGSGVKKLLNVDMAPYSMTPDEFAEHSSMQAAFLSQWYSKVDKSALNELYLAAFLQNVGAILIASDVIKDDETYSFLEEFKMSNNLAQLEASYAGDSSSYIAAAVFEHWMFDEDFVNMIEFADKPQDAPENIAHYSSVLNILKTLMPLNRPFNKHAINFATKKVSDAGLDVATFESAVEDFMSKR